MNEEEKVTEQDLVDIASLVKRFLAHPETVFLYRGENKVNQNGLHFTTDKEWAKNFGANIFRGRLPAKSKIKVLTIEDFEKAFVQGIGAEMPLWNSIFEQGYDAILGTDIMSDKQIDVIVNPKHLVNFKLLSEQ
jgi:hypothetical protein